MKQMCYQCVQVHVASVGGSRIVDVYRYMYVYLLLVPSVSWVKYSGRVRAGPIFTLQPFDSFI